MPEPALQLRNIGKSYFGNPVLRGVNLEVDPGEIHALVGENGAGKSTLMNVLFGMPVIQQTGGYAGEILLGGTPVSPQSPADAMAHGVGMVHQEFMLLPGFTVAENIRLNREITRKNVVSAALRPFAPGAASALETVDMPAMRADAREALGRVGISLDETRRVAGMPVGHMQFVEIAREVDKENARLIVFDEPTAVLTESEAEQLLAAMRRLAARGIAILFISHRLDEVMAVADRITVLRDGEVVRALRKDEASVELLAELMIGRVLQEGARDGGRRLESPVDLSVRGLHVNMPGEETRGVDFDVRRGEIFGIGGLAGQGKLGIANGIAGLFPATGVVAFAGNTVPLGDPRGVLGQGIAFVSEDRRGVGLLLDESISRNIAVTAVQVQGRFLRGRGPLALFDRVAARDHAVRTIDELDIRCRGPRQPVRRLSGGNQQKVCLARAFTLQPKLLLVSEPTRGVDVGAKDRVLRLLVELNRKRGTTIVLASSELAELRRIADRIAIIDKGKVAGILPPEAPDVEFGLLMGGGRR